MDTKPKRANNEKSEFKFEDSKLIQDQLLDDTNHWNICPNSFQTVTVEPFPFCSTNLDALSLIIVQNLLVASKVLDFKKFIPDEILSIEHAKLPWDDEFALIIKQPSDFQFVVVSWIIHIAYDILYYTSLDELHQLGSIFHIYVHDELNVYVQMATTMVKADSIKIDAILLAGCKEDRQKIGIFGIMLEYFSTSDVEVVSYYIKKLGAIKYHLCMIKKVVSMSFGSNGSEKEMAFVLLRAQYAYVDSVTQFGPIFHQYNKNGGQLIFESCLLVVEKFSTCLYTSHKLDVFILKFLLHVTAQLGLDEVHEVSAILIGGLDLLSTFGVVNWFTACYFTYPYSNFEDKVLIKDGGIVMNNIDFWPKTTSELVGYEDIGPKAWDPGRVYTD